MRAPLLALSALLACLVRPGGAHPRLLWPAPPAEGAKNSANGSQESSWILSLRDRSHAAALCAEAEGRRGPLRRFAGACSRAASGRTAPLGLLHFRPAGSDQAAMQAQLAALLRAFRTHVLEFAERDAPVRLAAVPDEARAAPQRCSREMHALDRLDQARLPLDGAYAAPWWPSAGCVCLLAKCFLFCSACSSFLFCSAFCSACSDSRFGA